MKIYKGVLIVKEDMTVDYEEVDGSIEIYEGAKLSAPNLKKFMGSVFVEKNAKLSAQNLTLNGDSIIICKNFQCLDLSEKSKSC